MWWPLIVSVTAADSILFRLMTVTEPRFIFGLLAFVHAIITECFPTFFLVTMRVFCAFLDWMYSLFGSYRSSSLIRSNPRSFGCLCSPFRSVLFWAEFLYIFIQLRLAPRLFSDFLWLSCELLICIRPYFPIADLGISSKSFLWCVSAYKRDISGLALAFCIILLILVFFCFLFSWHRF